MNHPDQDVPEELEALIPQMDSPAREREVDQILRNLPGVDAVGVAPGSVWLSFHPGVISRKELCQKLRQAGFPPTLSLENGRAVEC